MTLGHLFGTNVVLIRIYNSSSFRLLKENWVFADF